MKSNIKKNTLNSVNEVGTAVHSISAEKQLSRLVMANMLFENQFYMDGQSSADLIKNLVPVVNPHKVAALAVKARTDMKLRHVPLLLTRELARIGKLNADVLNAVVQRADEMGEFLSLYWSEKKVPLANQVKKGLAMAFKKFNEYQLAKWDKNSAAVRMRDVMFLTHVKPDNKEQEELFKRVAEDKLATPDTWEVELSGGADKAETFTRLMDEKKLGALAFLRNLRNMVNSGVPESTIREYASTLNVERVLPFRYVAAARIMPQFEDMLEGMMLRSLSTAEKLNGKTLLLIDVSGSMFGGKVSAKSDLDRFDAASALAMLCREICDEADVYSFSYDAVRVAPRRGFALREAIYSSQDHGGTNLGTALNAIRYAGNNYDRIIVFTDEQSYDRPTAPWNGAKGYVLNVASYQNGINNSSWIGIDGFSEAVIDYIRESEKLD